MKIREFIQGNYDVNIYYNIDHSFCATVSCPIELTSDGEDKFALALDCEIELAGLDTWGLEAAVVMIDMWKPWTDQQADISNVAKLFLAAIGYCSDEEHKRWFK